MSKAYTPTYAPGTPVLIKNHVVGIVIASYEFGRPALEMIRVLVDASDLTYRAIDNIQYEHDASTLTTDLFNLRFQPNNVIIVEAILDTLTPFLDETGH